MNNRTPEGDGNQIHFSRYITAFMVMNNRTPEGDGNPLVI